MIRLHVEPRLTKTWDAFRRDSPARSIALDGYVHGPPAFDPAGPFANFDHHLGVDRLCTRSTCMQVYVATTMGLFDAFSLDGSFDADVYINDPDQDTALAVWVLRNPDRCRDLQMSDPLAELLVVEDLLDCTAGGFPIDPTRVNMEEQAWVFEPYFRERLAGRVHGMDAAGMSALIDEVGDRITAHADGDGQRVELDTRHDVIGGGPGWKLIVEQGSHARTALFNAGVRAFVSAADRGDGSWTYSVGRMSPFVRFPLLELYTELNEAEGCAENCGWGGSNTIGGSPREKGSRLDPKALERVVNGFLARQG